MAKDIKTNHTLRRELLAATALTALIASPAMLGTPAWAQTAAPPADSGTIALPEVEVEATGPAQGGDRFTGYSVPNAVSATKTDTPILQTPVAVQVVPRETIDDQQAITVQDAVVGNVSSVSPVAPSPHTSSPTIRGFNNTGFSNNDYRNGLLQIGVSNLDTANLQSIEVLKGPAAVLYGRLQPGGLIDLLPKRPLETHYYSFQEQAGSFGLTRTTVDAAGPLTDDKAWLYRFNADFQYTNSFIDFLSSRNILIAPTITYHPIEQFRFNLDAEYQHASFIDDGPGIPAVGNRPAPIPLSRYLADPSVTVPNPDPYDRWFGGYDWNFDISNNWSLTNRLAYTYQYQAFYQTFVTSLDPISGIENRNLSYTFEKKYELAGNLDLNGKFDTGPLKHNFWGLSH